MWVCALRRHLLWLWATQSCIARPHWEQKVERRVRDASLNLSCSIPPSVCLLPLLPLSPTFPFLPFLFLNFFLAFVFLFFFCGCQLFDYSRTWDFNFLNVDSLSQQNLSRELSGSDSKVIILVLPASQAEQLLVSSDLRLLTHNFVGLFELLSCKAI